MKVPRAKKKIIIIIIGVVALNDVWFESILSGCGNG